MVGPILSGGMATSVAHSDRSVEIYNAEGSFLYGLFRRQSRGIATLMPKVMSVPSVFGDGSAILL
jgi:hypothetical protein